MAQGRKLKGWRKIAASTWGEPNDPQIYGDLEVDVGPALAYIESVYEVTGIRLSLTHLVGRALAHAFAQNPDLNGRLHRGRFVPRDSIDIFYIVSAEAGQELSGVKVRDADTKSALEIAEDLRSRAARISSGDDAEFGRTKTMLATIPPWLLAGILRLSAWLTVDLDLDLSRFGLPRQAFGSAMVSSVGMFGIGHAYAPLSPYYRIPLLVLIGEAGLRPVVNDDGQVEARHMVTLSATIDHRYLDGFHAARMSRSIREYFADPSAHEPQAGDDVVEMRRSS